MTRVALGFLILLFSAEPALTDGISVSQSVDETSLAFTDSVTFEIVLEWDGPQTAYFFDKPLNPQMEGLKIRRFASSIGSSVQNGREVTTKRFSYILEPTSVGLATLEPVTVSYVSWPDSIPGRLVTEGLAVNVGPPEAIEESSPSFWWVWLLAGFAVAACGLILLVAIRRRSRKPADKIRTPREEVLERLTAARVDAGADLKRFQTEVYKILVAFLNEQHNIDAVNLQTDSLLKELEAAGVAADRASRLSDWLRRAEQDKYSPGAGSPGDTVRLETELREFFEKY